MEVSREPKQNPTVNSPEGGFVAECEKALAKHFGLQKLRENQADVLELLQKSTGVLAMLPTGAGKTLLYALPAMVWKTGPVIVVCPLISLMKDQLRRMQKAGIPSVLFTSEQDDEDRRKSYGDLYSGVARIVFVSPERFVLPSFQRALVRVVPSMVVVDEAHCAVSWGHGFRPEYQMLAEVLRKLAPNRILALTATASRFSRKLISERVFPKGTNTTEYVRPPLASNIYMEAGRVYSENEKWEALLEFLRKSNADVNAKPDPKVYCSKTIVYFTRRAACEEATRSLRKQGIHAVTYHAGMRKLERTQVQEYLHVATKPTVVCATQAFGMGIDLPDVDAVVAYGFPSHIEEFFQMCGRAGRRGTPARAVLFWSGADPKLRTFQLESSYPRLELLQECMSAFRVFLPEEGCRKLVSHQKLEQAIVGHGLKPEKVLNGVVNALRFFGVLEQPLLHDSQLEICLSKGISLDDLRVTLPPGVTKRGMVLDAIARLSHAAFQHAKGATTVVSLGFICDELQWGFDQIEGVLTHFASSGSLLWRMYQSSEVQQMYLASGNKVALHRGLAEWVPLRNSSHESLAQLERFANAKLCRMQDAEGFFSARSVSGASARSSRCLRCDLCLASKSKAAFVQRSSLGDASFHAFAELQKQV